MKLKEEEHREQSRLEKYLVGAKQSHEAVLEKEGKSVLTILGPHREYGEVDLPFEPDQEGRSAP